MKNEGSHVNTHLSHCHTQGLRGVRADHAGAHRLPHRHLQLHAAVLHAVHQGGAVRPPPPGPGRPRLPRMVGELAQSFTFPASSDGGSNVPLFRYVRTFCTHTAIGKFTVYFPYVLLVSALILFSIEKLTDKTFKYKRQMEAFYSLLPSKSEKEHTVRVTCILNCESAALFAEGWRGRGAARGGGVAELQVQLLRVLRLPHEEPARVLLWTHLPTLAHGCWLQADHKLEHVECEGDEATSCFLNILCISHEGHQRGGHRGPDGRHGQRARVLPRARRVLRVRGRADPGELRLVT